MALALPPANGTNVVQRVTPIRGVVVTSQWEPSSQTFQVLVDSGNGNTRWFDAGDIEVEASQQEE